MLMKSLTLNLWLMKSCLMLESRMSFLWLDSFSAVAAAVVVHHCCWAKSKSKMRKKNSTKSAISSSIVAAADSIPAKPEPRPAAPAAHWEKQRPWPQRPPPPRPDYSDWPCRT